MGLDKVWVIPLCTFVFSLAAFLVSYVMAASLGHVTTFWPYISDSGAFPPESCVFGQLLNLSALFLAITVYLRHRQIVEFYWHRFKQVGRWRGVSCFLLWVGYASAFGISMVANFQESNVLVVHYVGALMAFGCGLVYTWAQTVFSYMMNPKLARPIVSHLRLLLCLLASVFFVAMVVFGPILGRHQTALHGRGAYKWTGKEANYVEHMIGTCSEWMLAICFEMYVLSFAIELRHAYCHAPKLKLVAFLEGGAEPELAADVFDCCVVPAKVLTGVPYGTHNHISLRSTVIPVNDDVYLPAAGSAPSSARRW